MLLLILLRESLSWFLGLMWSMGELGLREFLLRNMLELFFTGY